MATRTIRVDYLARVEGEGALDLEIRDGRVTSAQLRIFEPPRFFEAFLRVRGYAETPDLVARICGICPIAYQMGAVHAIENAFGAKVDGQLRALRRLIYCGEWIESHALHVVMLHAPDFLGFPDGIEMARARRARPDECHVRPVPGMPMPRGRDRTELSRDRRPTWPPNAPRTAPDEAAPRSGPPEQTLRTRSKCWKSPCR